MKEEPVKPEEPVVKADNTTLKVLYQAYSGLNTGRYTDSSAKVLIDAIAAASAVLNNANATQEQIDKAASVLMAAVAGLEMKPAEAPRPEIPALKKDKS